MTPFDERTFGAELARTMESALQHACGILQKENVQVVGSTRRIMALKIMLAVQQGERDPQQLTILAVAAGKL